MKYWLHWQFENNVFYLIDWQKDNEYADKASSVFFPGLSMEEALGSVLAECHETQQIINHDIENQTLPNLALAKLGFVNSHIKATPRFDEFIGDYIECVYEVKE